VEQGSNVSELTYHVGWDSEHDPWFEADREDSWARVNYYGVPEVPYLHVDGRHHHYLADLSDSIEARLAVPSHIWMSLRGWADVAGDSVFMELRAVADTVIGPGQRLHMAIAETHTHWDTAAQNGQTDFYGALLRMYPSAAGQPFAHSGNTGDTLTFLARFAVRHGDPVPMLLNNMRFVTWVQDSSSREVQQSKWRVLSCFTEPQPGDTLYVGLPATFAWCQDVFPSNVTLELNRDYPNGMWETALADLSNTGSAVWTVTGPPTDHARFRLFSVADTTEGDTSAGDVWIRNAATISISPSSIVGEVHEGDTLVSSAVVSNTGDLEAHVAVLWDTSEGWARPLEDSFMIPVGEDHTLVMVFDARDFASGTVVNCTWVLAGNVIPILVPVRMTVTGLAAQISHLPLAFGVSEAHPNPFNPVTHIRFTLDKASRVKLVVYAATGREVATVFDGSLQPGVNELAIDGSGWAAGVYFLHTSIGERSLVGKLLLLK
jgi:hypothetical protein